MAKVIETPQGPVEFPDDMSDAQITATLRKQFAGAPGEQQAQPRRWSNPVTQWVGEFNPVRDVLKPAMSVMPGGETVANLLLPQTKAEEMLAALPGGQFANHAAGAGKLLIPALKRFGAMTAAGAAGGAMDEGVLPGAAKGALAGGVGEVGGYLVGKGARSAPGAERSIAKKDLGNVVGKMEAAVPEFRLPAGGQDLRDPTQAMRFAKGGAASSTLSQKMSDVTGQIDKRLRGQPIVVPALGDEPRTFAQAWKELGEIGEAGFGGTKANPTQRTLTRADERALRGQVLDQMNTALLDRDPSGTASKLFNTARQEYSTGTAYTDLLDAPGAFGERGQAMFDVPASQKYLKKEQGSLRHDDPTGMAAGGKMASAERTYTGTPGEATVVTPPGGAAQVTPAPPPPSVTIPGRDDFAPLADALHRGGGLGEMDYDWINNVLPGTGLTSRAAQFALRGMGGLPNVGRVYAGKTPRALPGGAQQLVNYEMLKAIGGLLPQQPPQQPPR